MMNESAVPNQATKKFTLGEAEAMLPLVRSIVNDICEIFQSVTRRRSDLRRFLRKGPQGVGSIYADEVVESRADLQEEYDRIWQYRAELEALGVLLRQPEEGCIEFPAVVQGCDSFYIWRLGEEKIRFYRAADMPTSTRNLIAVAPKCDEA